MQQFGAVVFAGRGARKERFAGLHQPGIGAETLIAAPKSVLVDRAGEPQVMNVAVWIAIAVLILAVAGLVVVWAKQRGDHDVVVSDRWLTEHRRDLPADPS